MKSTATTTNELKVRAENVLGIERTAELIAMDLMLVNKEAGKAYNSFKDAEYQAIQDVIMYRSLTWTPSR